MKEKWLFIFLHKSTYIKKKDTRTQLRLILVFVAAFAGADFVAAFFVRAFILMAPAIAPAKARLAAVSFYSLASK